MLNSKGNLEYRTVARWAALTIGAVGGLLLFGLGLQALFTVGNDDTWLTILAASVAYLTLLPLSVLGIFRPRAAAMGITVSLLVSLLDFTVSIQSPEKADLVGLGLFFLYFVAPQGSVATLLFYSYRRDSTESGGDAGGHSSNAIRGGKGIAILGHRLKPYLDMVAVGGRRRQAQWAAIVLGLIAGAWQLPWAVFSLARSIRSEDWLGVVGITATALTLFPLSILAIFKPRPAAYALVVSLVAAAAYPLARLHPLRFGSAEILSGMLFYALFYFPLALAAGLLLYAASGRDKTVE